MIIMTMNLQLMMTVMKVNAAMHSVANLGYVDARLRNHKITTTRGDTVNQKDPCPGMPGSTVCVNRNEGEHGFTRDTERGGSRMV